MFSLEEEKIMSYIVDAWNLYVRLADLNCDDTEDFRRSIHELQRILAVRVMRREYPEYWR